MIYVWFTAGLLVVGGLLAMAIVRVRRQSESAMSALRERQRAVSEKLAKIETILAEKATVAEVRNLAAMVDGVASISRRLEGRLSTLEVQNHDPRREPADD